MKDAFGGILNLFLIAIFLIIVFGIMAFIVSYTKAFKMKNVVISAIEQYEGYGCFDTGQSMTACRRKIEDGAKSINYSPTTLSCPNGYNKVDGLFCASTGELSSNAGKDWYLSSKPTSYRIVTQVDLQFPIINKIMGLHFFQVAGDTRVIDPVNG